MAKKYWRYTSAPQCKVGLMKCCYCKKSITEGYYRYYETEDAYIPQHRSCCADDPKWAEIDAEDKAQRDYHKEFLAACIDFKAAWSISELDELIEELTEQS